MAVKVIRGLRIYSNAVCHLAQHQGKQHLIISQLDNCLAKPSQRTFELLVVRVREHDQISEQSDNTLLDSFCLLVVFLSKQFSKFWT